jgi:thiamine-monophosphate kinase
LHSTIASVGERALIERITARLSLPPWVVVGPGDDAAVVEPARGALEALTTDAQVEGIHFDRRFVPPDAIGHRALAVNLSDLAAMGALPRAALLSLVVPAELTVEDLDRMLDGLLGLANRHRVALVGGNVTRSPGPLVIDMTLTGAVARRRILTRGGARPGDDVYVTGTIGDGLVGLQSLQGELEGDGGSRSPARHGTALAGVDSTVAVDLRVRRDVGICEERYLRPEPRVRAGVLLGRNRAASACMDLSDGLADAVRQVAQASQVGMVLQADALPIREEVRRWHRARGADPVMASLGGGDDYELLFTVSPRQRGRLRAAQKLFGGVPITKIGAVTKDPRLVVRSAEGDREMPHGFEHFR